MINKRDLEQLNRYNLLSDKQYVFRSSTSTADVLNVIRNRSEALDNNYITRALDISKSFDEVWQPDMENLK